MVPLVFVLLFPASTMPLDVAELDAFPDSWLIWKWLLCIEAVTQNQDAGKVRDEYRRHQQAIYHLSFAKWHRELKEDSEVLGHYRRALRDFPEWRFGPSRVLMLPYNLIK